jgi:uncharacterized HAD superfamily protein
MRIGFDIDGVLADFVTAYQDAFVRLTGRNTFLPGDNLDPPEWNWPTLRGYTKEETSAVWEHIKSSSDFWLNLQEDPGCSTLRTLLYTLEREHEVYYITSRMGQRVKRQTEIWLIEHLRYPAITNVYPTVLIVGHRVKGIVARALQLDVYIDDNMDNVNDCAHDAPHTRTYLLNRAYNQRTPKACEMASIHRVETVGTMFDAEIAEGNL